MQTKRIKFPPAFKMLSAKGKRYKVLYGGRGCVDEDTEISTPSGMVKIKDFSGGLLYAYDGEKIVITFGSKPKKYDAEKLYKVSTASYNITVTANHRFLTNRGWLRTCDLQIGQDCLAISNVPSLSFQELFSPLVTNSDTYLQEWLKDALGCLQKVEGWICHYWLDYHRCGAPPQTVSDIALGVLPLQDDEQLHMSHALSRMDDQERAYINALFCRVLSLNESWVAHRDEVGKSSAYLGSYICDKFSELFLELHRVFQQFHGCSSPVSITRKFSELVQAFYYHSSQDESFQRAFELLGFSFDDSSCSYSFHGCNLSPHTITQEKVESIEYVGEKYFYDIQVPIYHNYIGNNIVNHNSGKSWACARHLLGFGFAKPVRILCAREIQRSINDSVQKLLCEQAAAMGLDKFYTATRDAIRGANGTEFLFKGLRANPQEIKSMEGIDYCWIEEAQAVSAESWDVLIPTIRKEVSEIWVTFNPLDENDPTYQRFVVSPPDNAIVRKVNYDENPYFPDVLRQEMEWLKSRDYESYLHIWEGECRKISNALVFGGRFRVEPFDTPNNARFYHGADWGFANDPTTLVRSFVDNGTLYIDQEAWGVGVEIDQTPQLFDSVDTARRWPIKADCARPETISYMRRQGFNVTAAKKWQGSIEDGLEFIKTFDIVIHPRCRHIIDEFNRYSYKVDKQTGDILPVIVDAYNHGIDALRYSLDGLIKGRGTMKINPKAITRPGYMMRG